MCGGIAASLNKIPKKELEKFYRLEEIKRFEKTGQFQSFFWGQRPLLPVEEEKDIKLYDWGNRDRNALFPQTGWTKKESLEKDKWNWLKPRNVKIPVEKGFEKKVWFDLDDGARGVLVEIEGDKRVYMITESADPKYLSATGHPRMPLGHKSNFRKIKNRIS